FTSLRVGPIKEGFIVGFDLPKTFIDMGSRIKANEGSSLEVYDAKVSGRSRLYLLKTIAKLHKKVYNNDSKYHERHLKKLAIMGPTFMPTYTLQGFVFTFKIWLLETYPNSKTWWVEEKDIIPRVVAWSDGTLFLKNDCDRLFHVRNRLRTLTSSSDEMKHNWRRMSLKYFHNLSKVKVYREVDVRTNVHHDVDEGLSVPDVHHDVEEGLSVPELLKKIFDMQRDF
nr:phospholipase-like protein [Tanacetum cinerariifolium]